MSFVEVTDTRVSRLHCTIRLEAPSDVHTGLQAVLEDHSSNGTYIDDERVQRGQAVPLHSGSKVSLVRSVTPWVERCFTFWEGDLTAPSHVRCQVGHGLLLGLLTPCFMHVARMHCSPTFFRTDVLAEHNLDWHDIHSLCTSIHW